MAEFTDTLTDKHIAFIERQPVYFTATAASEGRINLSPKGYRDTFAILDRLDLRSGSRLLITSAEVTVPVVTITCA